MSTQQHRGPNHVLVTRRVGAPALLRRTRKLLGKWKEVHVHGLGAAIAPAISLAARLVLESDGRLAAFTSTSTEMLIDRLDPEGGDADDELELPACAADGFGPADEGDSLPDDAPPPAGESSRMRFNSAVHIRLFVPEIS